MKTPVPRPPLERAFGLGLALAMLGLLFALGFRELAYAVTHPAEDLSFAFAVPVGLAAYGAWVAATCERKEPAPFPVVAGLLAVLLWLAVLYLFGLARGHRN